MKEFVQGGEAGGRVWEVSDDEIRGNLGWGKEDVSFDGGLGVGKDKIDGADMPIVKEGEDKHETNRAPGDDRRVSRPVIDVFDGAMTAGAKAGLPFEDFAKWVSFALEGPDHWEGTFVCW